MLINGVIVDNMSMKAMFLADLLKKHGKVIISQRNNGFGDNLLAAANAWYYARRTNRTLAVVWQPSRYLADKKANAFSYFFRVPESIEGVPVIAETSIDPASIFLISHPLYYLPFPDPLLLIYKLFSKTGSLTDNLFNQRARGRQRATEKLSKIWRT